VISVAGNVIIDACTLRNFAVVGRLDLLELHYGQRTRWTESIKLEITRGLQAEPSLQDVLDAEWLSDPIEIAGNVQTLQRIERIRRGLGATRHDPATRHLGEAEVIDYLETRGQTWMFVSDDQPAIDFAKRRGLDAIDTQSVLADCYASEEIGCPEAYNLLLKMQALERGVRVPPDHRYVCP
jgi:predicted nucleic acid-binding protein